MSGLTTDVTISTPANTQVLTYNSDSSKWINQTVPRRYMTYSRLKFLNKNHFAGDPVPLYTVDTNIYSFFLDQTGVTINSAMNLQSLTGNGTRFYYIQVLGTAESYSIGIVFNGFGGNHIYTANSTWSTIGAPLAVGNTYLLTYYENGGNPWAGGSPHYPCYTAQVLGSSVFQLQSNIDIHLFETNNYNTVYGSVYPPSDLTDGRVFRIRDKNGYLNVTRVTFSGNDKTINSATSQNLETANGSYLYTYVGDFTDIMSL